MHRAIILPPLHPAQKQVLKEAKRFNVLCNGRRWGKTLLAKELTIRAGIEGLCVGYFAPTYKDLSDVWNSIKYILYDVTKRKNEQFNQIELFSGGIIDFWSMDEPNSGRGRRYARVILDEFEKAPKAKQAWEQTIRPTLTDDKGDAWILSTPKGINTYFKELFDNKNKYDNWMSWQMPTSANPFIDEDEIKQAESQLDPIIFRQEYLAAFTTTANKPFLYCFDDQKHISTTAIYKQNETVYLSFDFNVDPCTCVLWQEGWKWIHYIDEVFLNNSNIYEVCAMIKSKYPHSHFRVTGDTTGRSRHHTQKGNMNSYMIIKQELRLKSMQFVLPGANPPISETRTLCNAMLANHPQIFFHPENCKNLINDCRFTQVDDNGTIDTTQDKHTGHLLDGFRYSLYNFHRSFIKKGV